MTLDHAKSFAALADDTRLEIVQLLADSHEMPVNALVSALGAPQPTVSKHLLVLLNSGIVDFRKHGTQRMYRLNIPAVIHLRGFLSDLQLQMPRIRK